MTSAQVQRTLVKSPPELWAELSDPAALARHLGELGDIRITRIEPEHKVEWTADGASGTVLIKPSAWGTRVTLTASRTSEQPQPAPGATAPAPPPQASGQTHAGPPPPASDPLVASGRSEPTALPTPTPPIAPTEPLAMPAETQRTAAQPPHTGAEPPQTDAEPPPTESEPRADAEPPEATPEPRIAMKAPAHRVTPPRASAVPVAAPPAKPLQRFLARLSRWLHGPELEETTTSGSDRPGQSSVAAPASPNAGSYEVSDAQPGRASPATEPSGLPIDEAVRAQRLPSLQSPTVAQPPQATLQGPPARTPVAALSSQVPPAPQPPTSIARQPPREEPSRPSPGDSQGAAEEPPRSSAPAEPLERLAAGMPEAPAGNTPSREGPADEVQAVLTSALDSLGAAHHRPFSRS